MKCYLGIVYDTRLANCLIRVQTSIYRLHNIRPTSTWSHLLEALSKLLLERDQKRGGQFDYGAFNYELITDAITKPIPG
jgi:hypothetical protein